MSESEPLHPELAAGRWQTLTMIEQLANIGSDVDRAIRADEAGNPARRDRAIDRALELFDLTAADPRWRYPRKREVLRAREEFCSLFFGERSPGAAAALQKYFLHFAVAARRAGAHSTIT